MDCQSGIVARYQNGADDYIGRVKKAVAAARAAAMPVMYVQVGFRPGMPEVSSRNKLFGAIKASPEWQKMFSGDAAAIHPELAPAADEVVITKHRVSAFQGTDLEMVLRAAEIDSLVLLGIATSGVVLSTLVEAVDMDFGVTVISDCCADQDAELHQALTTKYFARRGDVVMVDEFVKALGA